MRIGMVVAIAEDHLQVELRSAARDLVQIESGPDQLIPIGHLQPVNPLHGEHARRAEFGEGLGNADGRVAFKQQRELLQIAFFAAEIQFSSQHAGDFRDGFPRAIRDELGNALGQQGQARQHIQVLADDLLDAGVLNLHRDSFARLQPSSVHLPDRCRGHRHVLEFGEQLFRRLSQLNLDGAAHGGRIIGRDIIPQLLEFFGQRDADEIGTRAEQLAQLDVRGSELREGQANAPFRRLQRQRLTLTPLELRLEHFDVQTTQPVGQTVLAQYREDFRPATNVAIDVRNRADSHRRLGTYRVLTEGAARSTATDCSSVREVIYPVATVGTRCHVAGTAAKPLLQYR